MFETDEEQEMLYTLSVNLEYFAQETERGCKYFSGDKSEFSGKRNYGDKRK